MKDIMNIPSKQPDYNSPGEIKKVCTSIVLLHPDQVIPQVVPEKDRFIAFL